MRKAINIALAALLVACATANAGGKWVAFEIKGGTNTTETLTDTEVINGYVDEVYLQTPMTNSKAVVSGLITANVGFAVSPAVGSGMTTTLLYTNTAFKASVKARPRIAQTDTAGSNLSSLTVPERYLAKGDTVTFRVSQATALTQVVYRAWIKLDE